MAEPSLSHHLRLTLLFFVFGLPTVLLIIGFLLFPYPQPVLSEQLLTIPLFLGLILLGIGFFLHTKKLSKSIKISGWVLFAFFWSTRPLFLYHSESGDVFNATVSIIGVYVLIYIAYHEWLSYLRDEEISCVNWIAGGSFIAGIIYFGLDNAVVPQLKDGLINVVAAHSAGLLELMGFEVARYESLITFEGTSINIIFACTAIQSMVLFVGMIGALPKEPFKKKLAGLTVTVIPIYFLNLIRNAGVIYLVGSGLTSFTVAHNYIAKAGSLIALIILLFITFKIVPSLYDEIMCLFELPKRNGPVENLLRSFMGKK